MIWQCLVSDELSFCPVVYVVQQVNQQRAPQIIKSIKTAGRFLFFN